MDRYTRAQVADQTLLRSAETNAGRERTAMADLLADLAEIDARQLYLSAAYPSLFAYCVGELRLSEDAAAKRIQAARVARRFPVLFGALAEGRLHLTAVGLLAPYLSEPTADELLAAVTHKSKLEIERLLAARFPRPDVLAWVEAIPTSAQHAPAHVEEQLAPERVRDGAQPAARHVEGAAAAGWPPAQAGPGHGDPRVKPLSAQSFGVQFTLSPSELDLVQYAQELLPGDVREVFLRALRAHVRELERGKFAATSRPRCGERRATRSARHIPADVQRAVWQRDGGQCAFVSDTGHRCQARRHIQFDHIVEVACGGEATVSGIRLLCRAHNQHAAERTFGAEFMRHKRIAAAEARAAAKAQAAARAKTVAPEPESERDVVPWLRQLGFRPDEARRAAVFCETLPDASLEARVRAALAFLVRPHRRTANHPQSAG